MKLTVLSTLVLLGLVSQVAAQDDVQPGFQDEGQADSGEGNMSMEEEESTEPKEARALNYYTAGLAVIEMQDGVFSQLFESLIMDDVIVCYEYSVTLVWDFTVKMIELFALIGYDWQTILTDLTYECFVVIHKMPIVFKECMRPIGDVEYIDELFIDAFDIRNYNFWIHMFENVLFNSGDIYQNMIHQTAQFQNSEWFEFGESMGRIVSDLFMVSTLDAGYLEDTAYSLDTIDPRWDASHSVIINIDGEENLSSMKVMYETAGKDAQHNDHNEHTMVMSAKPDSIFTSIRNEVGHQLKGMAKSQPNVQDNKKKIDTIFISKGTKFEFTDQDLPIHKRIQQIQPFGDKEKTMLKGAQQNEMDALAELIGLVN